MRTRADDGENISKQLVSVSNCGGGKNNILFSMATTVYNKLIKSVKWAVESKFLNQRFTSDYRIVSNNEYVKSCVYIGILLMVVDLTIFD